MWHWPQGTTALRSFNVDLDTPLLPAPQPCMLQKPLYVCDWHSHSWRPCSPCLFTTTPGSLPVSWVNSEMHRKHSLQFFRTKLHLVNLIRVPVPGEHRVYLCLFIQCCLPSLWNLASVSFGVIWTSDTNSCHWFAKPLIFERQLCSPLHHSTTEPSPSFDCKSLSKFIYYIFPMKLPSPLTCNSLFYVVNNTLKFSLLICHSRLLGMEQSMLGQRKTKYFRAYFGFRVLQKSSRWKQR